MALKTIRVLDNDQGYITLLDHMGREIDIINAARVSYDKQVSQMDAKDYKLLSYLIKNEHTSPLEMIVFKFEVYCPLFVARQWMRHRTWSFNEISRRYTSESIDFYFPKIFREQDSKNKQKGLGRVSEDKEEKINCEVVELIKTSKKLFDKMLQMGICREQARMILPQNMMTKFIGKIDLNNLLKFLKLRDHSHAQWEIRVYAQAIKKLIEPIVPHVVKEIFSE